VGIFPLFKPKPFFTAAEQKQLVDAIRMAEQQTSGEIRIYVESKNPMVDVIERAEEVFYKLKMECTEHRNGVLLYMATKHKELALFGDEGIYKATGEEYWKKSVASIIAGITADNMIESICNAVTQIGKTLKEKFPYEKDTDKNELPDEIVFGK
jgi:uncharacterized membrane protein